MAIIRDTNISGDLEEKLGKNIWWKPEIDKKEFKKLCVKRTMPGIVYTSMYFIALGSFWLPSLPYLGYLLDYFMVLDLWYNLLFQWCLRP
jgi:hypothetical protein